MNIILGKDWQEDLENKYTVLELDTFVLHDQSEPVTAFCLIETVGVEKMSSIPEFTKLHSDLMRNYKAKNWEFCMQAIEHLMPFWGAEVGSFYEDLADRISGFKAQDPGPEWTGVILRKGRANHNEDRSVAIDRGGIS